MRNCLEKPRPRNTASRSKTVHRTMHRQRSIGPARRCSVAAMIGSDRVTRSFVDRKRHDYPRAIGTTACSSRVIQKVRTDRSSIWPEAGCLRTAYLRLAKDKRSDKDHRRSIYVWLAGSSGLSLQDPDANRPFIGRAARYFPILLRQSPVRHGLHAKNRDPSRAGVQKQAKNDV